MAAPRSSPSAQRLDTLDSLRGVFALIVVVHHFILSLVPGSDAVLQTLKETPAAALMAGRAPVIVFFVLSGFVLMLPFVAGKHQPYGLYALRRFIRIYIPFACSMFLAAVLYKLSAPGEVAALTGWFKNSAWDQPPHMMVMLKHLLMTGRWEDMRLNPVMWSLVHELRISLMFPLIAAIALRSQAVALALAALLYFVGFHGAVLVQSPMTTALFDTVRFSAFFIVGAVMATRLAELKAWAADLGSIAFAAVLGGIICVFSLEPSFLTEILFAGAAVGAIALAAGARQARPTLESAPLRWLGRVSFSLYLVHMPVMLGVYHFCLGRLGVLETTILAVVAVFVISEIFYRLFEKPSHILGRSLSPSRAGVLQRAAHKSRQRSRDF